MSDYLSAMNDRRHFLGLKVRAGIPLTPEEQADWERTKDLRLTPTTGGTVYVEAPPMDVAAWKQLVARERAEGGWIQRIDDMTDKPHSKES